MITIENQIKRLTEYTHFLNNELKKPHVPITIEKMNNSLKLSIEKIENLKNISPK